MTDYHHFVRALEYLEKQDLEKGLYFLETSGKQGCIEAFLKLGDLYWFGQHNVTSNVTKALEYYKKCSDEGNEEATIKYCWYLIECDESQWEPEIIKRIEKFSSPDAMAIKARILKISHTQERNVKKAFEILTDAYKQGSKMAGANLSVFYLQGLVVDKDFDKFKEICLDCIDHPDAMQLAIAHIYSNNPDDEDKMNDLIEKAVKLHKIAVWEDKLSLNVDPFHGCEEFIHQYEMSGAPLQRYIQVVYDNLENQDPEEDPDMSHVDELKIIIKNLMDKGYAYAYFHLAELCFESKIGFENNQKKVIGLCKKAIELGDVYSWLLLGDSYQQGIGIEQSDKKTLECYKKGLPNIKFCAKIGQFYTDLEEYENAILWFEKGVAQDDLECLNQAGTVYVNNLDDPKTALNYFDRVEALDIYGAHPDVKEGIIYCLHELKMWSRCLKVCKEMIDDPDDQTLSALNILSIMYRDGTGVKKDPDSAALYLQRAVDEGDTHAMCNLGEMYESGESAKLGKNIPKAIEMFQNALKGPTPSYHAARNLGNLYLRGRGVKQDYEQAEYYFKLALENDIDDTFDWLCELLIKTGRKDECLTMIQDRIDQDDADAYYTWAMLYIKNVIPMDLPKAYELIKTAVEMGCDEARLNYAFLSEKVDIDQAIKLYAEIFQETGMEQAAMNLSEIYSERGDFDKCFEYSVHAAKDHPDPHAIQNLGICYLQGLGCKADLKKASECFTQVNDLINEMYGESTDDLDDFGDTDFLMGRALELGLGMDQDEEKAMEFYEKAVKMGNEDAIKRIGVLKKKIEQTEKK